jgi:hypothetical protein
LKTTDWRCDELVCILERLQTWAGSDFLEKEMNAIQLADKLINYPCSKASLETAAGEMIRAQHAAIKTLREALNTVEWHGGGSCWVVDAEAIEAALAATETLA